MPTSTTSTIQIHGTAIAWNGAAVLLRGQPGSGKSDLALRCIGATAGAFALAPALLLADDRVMLTRRDGILAVSAPPSIKGLLEVRGLGIVSVPTINDAVLRLVIDLVPPSEIERMPAAGRVTEFRGIAVPLISLTPFEASAPLKVLLALRATLPPT